jgi:DNA-binding transcriptional ArsR family regulator
MKQDPSLSALLHALADPTRRVIYERITAREEITVVELTSGSGVTQGAVSQHLKALKSAGLVDMRPEGRRVFYRATPQGLAPLASWFDHYGPFWHSRFAELRTLLQQLDPKENPDE